MSLLFVNISSDRIQLIAEGKETILPHGDLEKTVADFMYSGALEGITKAFIINGPGSFTHLRIATLALNMYNFLHENSIDFYTIDKLALYKKLYEKKILPSVGYIYIGQKKNRRKVYLETMSHETVQERSDEDTFIDELFEGEKTERMVRIGCKGGELHVTYKGDEHVFPIADFGLDTVKALEANYMMEANVTMLPSK